jgi:CubicO group peptidase (beta-lactamase class C family)
MTMRWAASLFLPLGLLAAVAPAATAADPSAIEQGLAITAPDGTTRSVDLEGALKLLKVPSASIALIDRGEIAFARAFGESATPDTLYQAASLSKFVAAIGAMRLVEEGTLELDQDVNEALTSWRIPPSDFDRSARSTRAGSSA